MKKLSIKLILPSLFLIASLWPLIPVKADNLTASSAFGYFFDGAQTTANKMGYTASTTDGTSLLLNKISFLISFLLGLLGVIFIILTIYGGFLWMTAAGNEKQVDTAKNIMTRAITGLVIVMLAYAISFFIIKRLAL